MSRSVPFISKNFKMKKYSSWYENDDEFLYSDLLNSTRVPPKRKSSFPKENWKSFIRNAAELMCIIAKENLYDVKDDILRAKFGGGGFWVKNGYDLILTALQSLGNSILSIPDNPKQIKYIRGVWSLISSQLGGIPIEKLKYNRSYISTSSARPISDRDFSTFDIPPMQTVAEKAIEIAKIWIDEDALSGLDSPSIYVEGILDMKNAEDFDSAIRRNFGEDLSDEDKKSIFLEALPDIRKEISITYGR